MQFTDILQEKAHSIYCNLHPKKEGDDYIVFHFTHLGLIDHECLQVVSDQQKKLLVVLSYSLMSINVR